MSRGFKDNRMSQTEREPLTLKPNHYKLAALQGGGTRRTVGRLPPPPTALETPPTPPECSAVDTPPTDVYYPIDVMIPFVSACVAVVNVFTAVI